MPRPVTASDDEILLAAKKVLNRRGPDAFSIAEVASEVGLSRAAIILRFKSTHALKVASLRGMIDRFVDALATLPQTPSGDNLLRFAAFLGQHVGSREGSTRFFANYYHDRELFELERKRGDALHAAVLRVMPETSLDRNSAAIAFRAHLTGTIMAWLALDDEDPRRHVVLRTAEWLKLAGIAFSDQLASELSAPLASAKSRNTAKVTAIKKSRTAKSTTTRRKSTHSD